MNRRTVFVVRKELNHSYDWYGLHRLNHHFHDLSKWWVLDNPHKRRNFKSSQQYHGLSFPPPQTIQPCLRGLLEIMGDGAVGGSKFWLCNVISGFQTASYSFGFFARPLDYPVRGCKRAKWSWHLAAPSSSVIARALGHRHPCINSNQTINVKLHTSLRWLTLFQWLRLAYLLNVKWSQGYLQTARRYPFMHLGGEKLRGAKFFVWKQQPKARKTMKATASSD